MQKIRFAFLLIIIISPLLNNAQSIKTKQFGLSLGNQAAYCEKIQNPSDLNFLNYAYTDNFTGNLLYLTLNAYYEFTNNMQLNMVVGMYSDLAPVKYNFAFSYLPYNLFGIGVSFLGYPQYIDNYNQFHWDNDTGLIADLDANYRQEKVYNAGLAAGPEFAYSNSWLALNLRAHFGVRWVEKFNTSIVQKQINGNYKRLYQYHIGRNPNPYLLPELEVQVKVITLSKSSLGIKLRAAAELSKRTLNYTRTTYEWLYTSRVSEEITFGSQKYSTFETDLGIYFSW